MSEEIILKDSDLRSVLLVRSRGRCWYFRPFYIIH